MTQAKAPRASPGRPLPVKLAVIIASLVVAGLAVVGAVTTVVLRVKLVADLDRQLEQTLSSLIAGNQVGAAMSGPSDYVLMVFGQDGEPLTTAFGEGHDPDKRPALERLTEEETPGQGAEPFTVASTAAGGQWRCLTASARGPFQVRLVVLALPLDSINDTTRQVALLVVWLALAVAVVATASGYAMVRRSLRPLRHVETAAAQIARGDLTTRMPPAQEGTEVGHLTDSLNAMLTQIEAAFASQSASEARMRTFISDASHELRTPLAAIRGYAELYRIGGLEQPEALAGAMKRIEDEAARMGAMVGDLSTLTRLAELQTLELAPVDLLTLAADAVADAQALDPGRTVTLLAPREALPPIAANEAAVRRVLTNLVSNAIKHTPPATPIEVAIAHWQDVGAVIEVRDHGPGIPPAKRDRVFDRFFRLDDSRSRDLGGSGLGLAIVTGLVGAHGGEAEVVETPGGGATFRITLPG
ncbi:MAG: HAMP domain-containing histidine kinase [Bifidobacteriaceae bacterium]|jgi:two-component system OmpR family sensor kinase|nr:HAMP domain-containing histidine kinase [Bifidobacteriaceae bacterium]